MDSSAQVIIANLTSPPVLAFALGLLAVLVKGDLRLPDPIYQGLSIYLLLGIGIKGGVALRQSELGDVAVPALATIILGLLIPVLAFLLSGKITKLSEVDRGAIAAHYGSTSLVTFTAALVFLEQSSIQYEGFVTTLLALLEIPGIIVGLMLGSRHLKRDISWSESLQEIFSSRSILLLVGGLVLGFATGTLGYAKIEPFFGALFIGMLTLFLLEMGTLAGRRMRDVKTAGVGLIVFAIVFPIGAGVLGVVFGYLSGLSMGGAAALGVLAASASYIAAPAAVRLALPEANPGIYLAASLGITFPFNLTIGIPLIVLVAQSLEGMVG
jgi:uncharacterized protein